MGIVRSKIVFDQPQADGRRWVREEHTADDGRKATVDYKAAGAADAVKRMTQRVAEVEEQFASEDAGNRQALVEASVQVKIDGYIKSLPDITLQTAVGLTDAELVEIKSDG
ncbi:MAG: hypothetical protein ACREUV_10820 [Burkholderiales bacterium]